MIFSVFNSVEYKGVRIADIFHNIGFYYNLIVKNFDLEEYTVKSSDRPERVASKIYGDPNLYWVLFLANNISDPFHGWVKEEEAVHKTTQYRYQNSGGSNVVDHHIDEKGRKYYRLVEYPVGSGNWYDEGDSNRTYIQYEGTLVPVTRIEEAINQNDIKADIEIIKPSDIDRFLDLMSDQIERVKKDGKD